MYFISTDIARPDLLRIHGRQQKVSNLDYGYFELPVDGSMLTCVNNGFFKTQGYYYQSSRVG